MNNFEIRSLNGRLINSLDDWRCYSAPKDPEKHWKAGRSAMELARAWVGDGYAQFPSELMALLNSRPETTDFIPEFAIPEAVTILDRISGGGRNHDLIVVGHAGDTKTLISIEAKVDEHFGNIIRQRIAKAPVNSKAPARIEQLSKAIFGRPLDDEIENLRDQLLHALAGTLIEAKNHKAEQAVLVIHEFQTNLWNKNRSINNTADLVRFVQALPGNINEPFVNGTLIGSLAFPEFVPNDIPLFIGKIETQQ